MTCPECGATNPKGAEWCSLCAAPFGTGRSPAAESESVSVAEAPAAEEVAPVVTETPTEPATAGDDPIWTCGACGEHNPIDADACATCGTSIFEAHGADGEEDADRERAASRAWVPGVGQSALGDPATGGMVVATIALSGLFGLLLLFGNGSALAGVLTLLVGGAVWGLGWFDTQQRLTRGMALLTPGRLLAIAGLVIVIVLFATTSVAGG